MTIPTLSDEFHSSIGHYRLVGRTPVRASMIEGAREMEQRWRMARQTGVDPWRVAETNIGEVRISTVFLGLDHGFGDGPPVLFETMIFGGEHDEYQTRCCTWDEAEQMHEAAVREVRDGRNP